jgi:hypothetical protein
VPEGVPQNMDQTDDAHHLIEMELSEGLTLSTLRTSSGKLYKYTHNPVIYNVTNDLFLRGREFRVPCWLPSFNDSCGTWENTGSSWHKPKDLLVWGSW